MDGMIRLADGLMPSPGPAGFLGILYAEDFDNPAVNSPETSETPEPAEITLTQTDIDIACAEAVDAARRDWERTQEASRTAALASLQVVLADARDAATQTALSVAEGTAVTMLSMLSGILPHFSSQHGAAEVQALVTRLLPTIRTEPRITIRVHPDLVQPLQRDVAHLETDLSGTISVVPAPFELGDVKVSWEAGSLTRNTREILKAMQDALSQLGLQLPTDAPPTTPSLEIAPKRRMAHAE